MFYAADGHRVYEFSRRQLRDAWAAETLQRSALTARDPRVRRSAPRDRFDGDDEAWYILARDRVADSPALRSYWDVLIETDRTKPEHWKWVATEHEGPLLRWARDTHNAARDAGA